MNFAFGASDEAFRAEVRAFLAERLPPGWTGIFRASEPSVAFSFEITRELAERGWLTMHWPREYGGAEASVWTQTVLQQELWAHHEPRGGQYMGANWVGPAIMRFGTQEQKRRFLPPIAAGEMQWAQLFSEPGAGSDLASLATTAIPADDGSFVINGSKIWISYADIAQYGFLVARSVAGSRRREGLSVLLIDMATPGIEVHDIRTPLGPHKIHEVFFTDAAVPGDALLGSLHDGWNVAMTALSFERSGVPRYARSTRTVGEIERLDEASEVADEIADALAFGRAAELVNYSVAAIKERGEVPAWEASASRVYNTLYENEVAALAQQVLGPNAIVSSEDARAVEDGEVEAFIRAAPTAKITAGTFEIQMGIIAQRGLGLERAR